MRKKGIISLLLILCFVFGTITASAAAPPADSYVSIINPVSQSIIYSDSLLISVKVTQPRTIRVTLYEQKQLVNGSYKSIDVTNLPSNIDVKSYYSEQRKQFSNFTTTNTMSFFTQRVSVTPGLYKVQVDTLDGSGKAIYSTSSFVFLREKGSEPSNTALFESQQNGAAQFLQNLLKGLFGN